MIYGCQIWGQDPFGHIEKISKLQDRALRIINFKGFHTDANPLYSDVRVLKLKDLIRLQNCLFVHDYLNNSLPVCFQDYYFKLNYLYHNAQTRNANLGCLFYPSRKTTKYGLNSITQKSIHSWNFFTKTIKTDLSVTSRHNLKSTLTKYLVDRY